MHCIMDFINLEILIEHSYEFSRFSRISLLYNTVFIFRDFNVMIEPEKRGRLNIGMN